MKRLLLDQGLPRSTAQYLNDQNWNVVHIGDIGMAAASDTEILNHARRDNRVCVTLDADFHALLAVTNATSPSVVRIRREGLNGKQLAEMLIAVWSRVGERFARGAMVTVTEYAIRIRKLPVHPRQQA